MSNSELRRLESSETRRGPSRSFSVLIISALTALVGCSADGIVFATWTRTGIEISPAEGGQQSVAIGYERAEGITMPTRRTDDEGNSGPVMDEAYPTLSVFQMDSGSVLLAGLGTTRVHSVFAVGKAANLAAQSGAVFNAAGYEIVDDCEPLAESRNPTRKLVAALRGESTREAAMAAIKDNLLGADAVQDSGSARNAIALERCTPEGVDRLDAAAAAL
ncbi:MAG: hypothetical protein NXI30_02480 [bacterium]|nr:hypothetical protein [bacterium]